MTFDPNTHHRQSIRLKKFDYSTEGAYFITICTYQKKCLFGSVVNDKMIMNELGHIVNKTWFYLAEYYPDVLLDQFVVMPNHIHGIIAIKKRMEDLGKHIETSLLGNVLRKFKSDSAVACNRILSRNKQPLWQRNYYERIIRNEREFNAIVEYIWNNPRNWKKDVCFSS